MALEQLIARGGEPMLIDAAEDAAADAAARPVAGVIGSAVAAGVLLALVGP